MQFNRMQLKRISKTTLTRRALKTAFPRVIDKLNRSREPFGIFILRGDIRMVRASTARFKQEERRANTLKNLVGIYNWNASPDEIREDIEIFIR